MKTSFAPFILLLLACAACAGQSTLNLGTPPVERQASYDPLAPAIAVPPLAEALATAQWKGSGAYQLTALTALNTVDTELLRNLRLEASGSRLNIRASRAVSSAGVYLRYDARQQHYAGARLTPDAAVSLVLEIEPGLLAIGVCAAGTRTLDPRQVLATLDFAAGPATAVRRAAKISTDTRTAVRDLTAVGEGVTSATLQWSERHTGDYDLNSEVNIADLTPIGVNYQRAFTPADADYAILEVADGDENGEINIADITPIGANFQSRISGYDIYRTPLDTPDEIPLVTDTGRWTKVANDANPTGPSAPRDYNGQDFRLVYTFLDECGTGDFGWYVVPVNYDAGAERGPASNVATVDLVPPNASLSFEIQPPAGPLANVGGEFYLAVKVNDVSGLFSANVRFEYDSTLVEYLEGVASYPDHPNLLTTPLFVSADAVGSADSPYVLVGLNATQTQGTAAVSGSGVLGYIKFKCIGEGVNAECFRFPQSTSFIYLWGETYGIPVATPTLGEPQILNVGP